MICFFKQMPIVIYSLRLLCRNSNTRLCQINCRLDKFRTLRDEHTPDHLEEFVIDHRTHKPTISEVGSLEEVARRHPSGLVVVDNSHWPQSRFVPKDVSAFLETRFERVPVPGEWRMRVYVWGEPGTAGGACTRTPSF